ncbi:MAG: CT583 family protein [Candidatus Neptunochlamydia sp.]|nr:CT583 family protein [Candidatus Neptunochlamydia sp.]
MSKFNSLLMERFKSHAKKEKMNELVERSSSTSLTNFSGPFRVNTISNQERASLQSLLEKYQTDENNISEDLNFLSTITSEVKAISNQAVILHGERIKKAQELFKKYRDGAFSNWILKTYGNRQTPYNFMQYYELYTALPKKLQEIVDEMPRQAIYSLSSRSVPQEKKIEFVKKYKGESKTELLEKLRTSFPLAKQDKRNPNKTKSVLDLLNRAKKRMEQDFFVPSQDENAELKAIVKEINALLN